MMRSSVIILTWNGREYIPACLDAILAQISPDDEAIVVDNNSADDSAPLVRERYPQVHLIENKHNLGFAGGCNAGLRTARGEYMILANQDVVVQGGWLEAMLKALTPDEVGIVGCKLLYPDGTIQHAGGGISYPLAHSSHYGSHEPDRGQWDTQREVEYVTGALLGLKRTLLDKIGLFDEGFSPAYYEEVDLCFRARAGGYKVLYTPDSVGIHHETTTVKQGGIDQCRWGGRGRLRFVLKHYTAHQFYNDFIPAERVWLASLTVPAMRAGLWLAYLDILLGLQDIPRTGVLAEHGNEEAVAEALTNLHDILCASPEKSSESEEAALASGLLAELPWSIRERPFVSKVPIIGSAIVRFRELWNSVAAKWYVRSLIEQQNEFNRRLVLKTAWIQENLAAIQRVMGRLDREMVKAYRLQVEMSRDLQAEVDCLRAQVQALEETLSALSE
jgi:GT2 family glycosyltransferase